MHWHFLVPKYCQPVPISSYPPYCNLFDFEKGHAFRQTFPNPSQRFRRSTDDVDPMIFIGMFFLDPQPLLGSIKERIRSIFEPYSLLAPLSPLMDEKGMENRIFNNECSLPCLSSKINDHNQSCSTLDTFTETPPHFDFDDYRLDPSPQQTIEKVIRIINLSMSH